MADDFKLFAVLRRRQTGFFAEVDVELFGFAEAGGFGNPVNQQVGFREQCFRPVDVSTADFLIGRTSDSFSA